MEPDESIDVTERIEGHVRKAHRIARWLRTCEIVYAVLCVLGIAMATSQIGPSVRLTFDWGGWEAVLGMGFSMLRNLAYLAFLLLLAETARRIVLVVAGLAEEVKGTV